MVGDACKIAYPIYYDNTKREWVITGSAEKVLYIMTEQDPEEIKTMILAYLTGINEEQFLYGEYCNNEDYLQRTKIAVKIMEEYKNNFIFAQIPDPAPSIVKNLFRKYNMQEHVQYFFYDYIFSSPNMLNEYRDLGLNESVLLRLFTTTLKNLAVELDAFIITATQISYNQNQNNNSSIKDITNLRGAKAIADVGDVGCFMSTPTETELELLKNTCGQLNIVPNCVIDIYKNRRGRYKDVRIWSYNNLGCCRREDLFLTDKNCNPITDFSIVDFKLDFSPYAQTAEEFNNIGTFKEKKAKAEMIIGKDTAETNKKTLAEEVKFSDHKFVDDNIFSDDRQQKKRLHNVKLGDLI